MLKKFIAATFTATSLALGVGAASMAPAAADPVITGGLVNVVVTDVASHNDVQVAVPIEIAADLCGINVNVLSEQVQPIDCRHRTTQDIDVALET